MEYRSLYRDRYVSQPADGLRIRQEVIGKHGVQVQDGIAIESDALGPADKEFNRILIVQQSIGMPVIIAQYVDSCAIVAIALACQKEHGPGPGTGTRICMRIQGKYNSCPKERIDLSLRRIVMPSRDNSQVA